MVSPSASRGAVGSPGLAARALGLVHSVLLVLAASGTAQASYCARDVVPASTLLVPWAVQGMASTYEPDYQGYTTFLNVINAASQSQIIHVTVWNAVGEPGFSFDEVLSGYDHWQICLRDVISGRFDLFDTSQAADYDANTGERRPFEWGPDGRFTGQPVGSPPSLDGTGLPAPQDTTPAHLPSAGCSMPHGALDVRANVDVLRAPLYARAHYGCGIHVREELPPLRSPVRDKFVGKDWLSQLAGSSAAAALLWFYVTVDVVARCDAGFPSDVGYFSSSYAEKNVLIGDVVYLSARSNYSDSVPAVRIESDASRSDLYNFYEETAAAADVASVTTEPLSTALAFEWYDTRDVTASILLWKSFHELWPAGGATGDKVDDCGPYLYYAWDENEHVISRGQICQVDPCVAQIDANEFPFQTQMVPIDSANFDLPNPGGQGYGWMLLIFPPSYGFGPPGETTGDPTEDPVSSGGDNLSLRPYMAWAAVRLQYGSYSTMIEATEVANAHCFPEQALPNL